MAVLDAELVQRLARHRGGDRPILTLYLNVDGRENIRPEDYQLHLESLVREVLTKDPPKAVIEDINRIQRFVTNEFERGNTRGLAVFAGGDDLWEVVQLPLPVRDQLTMNLAPHISQLERMLDEHETVGVLLTDRQRARLFLIELGQIAEREEIIDPLPRHDDDKGDWRRDHVKAHASVAAQHHLRNAANAMFDLYQRHHFENLVLGIAEELRPEMERQLHAYLRDKVIGASSLPITATDDELLSCAYEHVQKAERAREEQYVSRLRAAMAMNVANGRSNGESVGAVAGIDSTLRAVFEKRVDTLLVSEGYTTEGWRCTQCAYISTMGRKCKMCGSEMIEVQDVVEEAVEDALGQKCRVEFCTGNADLDVMGRIGALLRF